ncbi:DUF1003 domain-containing protein [Chitinibacter bivalviorum]|uniref:DUF1003 domain-containing protein n=1 Tax=Chitinibacter bivalviorum TaxID=2739434 RepID=A0A7H9BJU0_9NEIS|nr:DUF1003 domain-containing protein [Chitinibacter bivalviorum]QLG88739.1 DUF1003 domain-containing protein [Chitinibacter bivalviorum]
MRQDEQHLRFLAEHLLNSGVSDIGERERNALMRISRRLQANRAQDEIPVEGVTFGERLADRVAEFGGSWTFISIFGAFLVGWAILNTDILRNHAFDPYPYVFLNLILSMLASVQAPLILMSQNRQAARDRLTMIRDFEVNLKAEAAVQALNQRVEHLTWNILSDLNEVKNQLKAQPAAQDTESPAK